eukprot:CAMPEP_0113704330 /NCGR_PEP_ID=MMETSP0038_2-20120614/26449_1 /TAXON_ID=2898 /ORGANISM="Cryptomonas paramecium" /LENGTH=68 /DNA_ID=CAMNT_0000629079 /DNA_START=9 /DNA_END=211 /DNA_ORIENTATION=+ /assembly_acc=CAM_ASM_000170
MPISPTITALRTNGSIPMSEPEMEELSYIPASRSGPRRLSEATLLMLPMSSGPSSSKDARFAPESKVS